MAHGAAQTKPLIARFSLSFGVESRRVKSICALHGRVVISRMYIMDNIVFSTKKEIINNFPIESTYPPRSTHGGSFELPNT